MAEGRRETGGEKKGRRRCEGRSWPSGGTSAHPHAPVNQDKTHTFRGPPLIYSSKKKRETTTHTRAGLPQKKQEEKRGRRTPAKKKRLRSLHTTKHNSTHTNINNRLIRIEDHIEERGTEEKEKKKRLSVGHSLSDGGCVMCIWLWGEERSDSVKECGMVGNEATMSEGLILLEIFLSGFEILRVFFCVFLVD